MDLCRETACDIGCALCGMASIQTVFAFDWREGSSFWNTRGYPLDNPMQFGMGAVYAPSVSQILATGRHSWNGFAFLIQSFCRTEGEHFRNSDAFGNSRSRLDFGCSCYGRVFFARIPNAIFRIRRVVDLSHRKGDCRIGDCRHRRTDVNASR